MNIHFIFLIHGFMGNSNELSYIEEAIQEAITKTKRNEKGTDKGDGDIEIITHRVTCNNKKTFDGIEAGGERAAQEITTFVSDHYHKHKCNAKDNNTSDGEDDFHAWISFIGYSLGGMYARYAISALPLLEEESQKSNNGIVLHPNIFVTAATPHLGMASHSYWTVPRCMEYLLGYGFGRTGQDLFRLNRHNKENLDDNATTTTEQPTDIVYKMATEDRFLNPLLAFRRRISYINAFAADFQVPTKTAGMLSLYSNSPHHLMSSKYNHWNSETIGFDVFAFETKRRNRPDRGTQSSGTRSRKNDEALTMSISLDSLGWTKVFVDSRTGMPGPSVRCVCRHPRKDLMDDAIAEKKKKKENDDDNSIVFESRELCKLLKTSEHWHLAPSGHFVLVAHSKTKRGAKKSAKGRPLVNQAALDLVRDMRRERL